MSPSFTLENSENTLNIYALTLNWLLMDHILTFSLKSCSKVSRSSYIVTIIVSTGELLCATTALL